MLLLLTKSHLHNDRELQSSGVGHEESGKGNSKDGPNKMRAKDRPLANEFASDEEFIGGSRGKLRCSKEPANRRFPSSLARNLCGSLPTFQLFSISFRNCGRFARETLDKEVYESTKRIF